jgi:hypothetical protein
MKMEIEIVLYLGCVRKAWFPLKRLIFRKPRLSN